MAYTTIDDPTIFFNTLLYTGNGSSSHAITGVGFQPDWVWIKNRTATASGSHILNDSVRGTQKAIYANDTSAEYSTSDGLSAFGSDGFTVGNGAIINYNNDAYVAWNWLAGTSVSGNTGGSGTSKSYSGSVNTTSGFSIITYVGNGTAGHTIPHHLGAVPRVIFTKGRDQVENWTVYHEGLTSNNYALRLNDNAAQFSQTLSWNDTTPTSSVFTLGGGAGTNDYTNRDGINMIAYCFAEKKGYSKFGSYTGNANADGPMIYTGFRPAWFLVKNTAASEHWRIYDNKRDTFNHMYHVIYVNESSAESTVDNASEEIDFLSNGVKIRSSAAQLNGSGQKLIYMAFAEQPFVNSNGVPCNAR